MEIWEIVPGLYQSPTPRHPEDLQEFDTQDGARVDIGAIIDLEGQIDPNVPQEEIGEFYLYWPIKDEDVPDETCIRALARFVSGLMDAGLHVLVHCNQGLNRASLITARTLMERGMGAEEAVQTLRSRRSPDVLYNERFLRWLLAERVAA